MESIETYLCEQGHRYTAIAGGRCMICDILYAMRRSDSGIICTHSTYTLGQDKFEFICTKGHRFVADERSRECKSCKLLEIARKKHNCGNKLQLDNKCVHINDSSRLRFHCDKLRHDPLCTNQNCLDISSGRVVSIRDFAADCKNFKPCGQDFYATPKQIKYEATILSCKQDHRWVKNSDIISCVRLFELLYDDRFDDSEYDNGVLFTGYNKALGLAYTHNSDLAAKKCIAGATQWCEKNNVKFIVVAVARDSSQLSNIIVKQLCDIGALEGKIEHIVCDVRTRMRKMNSEHRLFDRRCVF